MSPHPRAAAAVAVLAVAALVLPAGVVVSALVAVAVVVVVDAVAARRPPELRRATPRILARGVSTPLVVEAGEGVRVRQPVVPDLDLAPTEGDGRLDAVLVPRRRGRHPLPAAVARTTGPLGLARWDHRLAETADVVVYPDLPAAHRLARAVRQGKLREQGRLARGALGLGTDFESVRDYSPDDDVRQVNWRATARLDRPMSNQYRVDQDRDVVCVVDTGRLMQAPVGERATRLDVALDAVAAVAMVADVVGDRCGTVAFDSIVRRRLSPRRAGGQAVVEALFDLEPSGVESDYELAFRTVGGGKRALVLVFTDLLDEAAARSLVDAVPVLARRHALVVASAVDPDIAGLLSTPPATTLDRWARVVADDVLEARSRAATRLTAAGAQVVEAPPQQLGVACVTAYLRMKARARL
ncbi:MAG TPA: DUF58 domain-containing protein [Acidimicrobiales bacterium]|nr:DUF58 domain-containing protein [Acidimicrobiales bacterium]